MSAVYAGGDEVSTRTRAAECRAHVRALVSSGAAASGSTETAGHERGAEAKAVR